MKTLKELAAEVDAGLIGTPKAHAHMVGLGCVADDLERLANTLQEQRDTLCRHPELSRCDYVNQGGEELKALLATEYSTVESAKVARERHRAFQARYRETRSQMGDKESAAYDIWHHLTKFNTATNAVEAIEEHLDDMLEFPQAVSEYSAHGVALLLTLSVMQDEVKSYAKWTQEYVRKMVGAGLATDEADARRQGHNYMRDYAEAKPATTLEVVK